MSNHVKFRHRSALILLLVVGLIWPTIAHGASVAPIRVACVGDSITWGDTLKHRLTQAWPGALQNLLGAHYKVVNFGYSGATMLKKSDLSYWTTSEFRAVTTFDPNIVIIMLGSNDTKTQNWKSALTFKADTEAMIRHFEHLKAHPKVYICTPPPLTQIHWHESEKVLVQGVIPQIKIAAKAMNIPVIHIYGMMMKHITAKTPAYYYSRDGVHPNPRGQALMARFIYHGVIAR